MSTETILGASALVLSLLAPIVVWLLNDTRSKTRLLFVETRLAASETTCSANQARIAALEIAQAESTQDRAALHAEIVKIDATKASKESLDGFAREVAALRGDMDKRFDKLERMLERSTSSAR